MIYVVAGALVAIAFLMLVAAGSLARIAISLENLNMILFQVYFSPDNDQQS